ncbi:MAG: hypothetical protein ISR95_02780 [Candidatus Marinimicrobia bacterium]|nr:hypothetical protein [Candidatus Brocadiales bacterium]MBL7046544.1 hypothetical protein [Candidatus Neomarinimicrobiota bacterium]
MKKLLVLLIFGVGTLFCQQYEDVVYLKDGSIIHGVIIEQVPNKLIKIQSGKNVFVYQLDEIEKMTKEITETSIDIQNKTWSVQVGLGGPRSFSLASISKDVRIGNHGSIFITAGLGTALIGGGFAIQGKYNDKGINFSGVLGFDGDGPAMNSSLNYQWRIGNQAFLSAGIMGGFFTVYDRRHYQVPYVSPLLAFDYRF